MPLRQAAAEQVNYFSSNDNDIITPFICGAIHVDSNPLCSFPAIAFLSDSCPAL